MSKTSPPQPWAAILMSVLVVVTSIVILILGRSYYQAPATDRIFSEAHHLYGPAGWVGLGCGIAATALFVSNLFYLVRKKFKLAALGTMRSWLSWHVASGTLGGILVALHCSFEMKSTVTRTAVWSMIVVLATGTIGRYMVRFIPRTRDGEQLGLSALEGEVMELVDDLRPAVVGDSRAVALLQTMVDRLNPKDLGAEPRFVEGLMRLRALKADLTHLSSTAARKVEPNRLRELTTRARGLLRYLALARFASHMMDGWRLFHRVIALLFLLAVVVHIAGVFLYGFL